MITLDNVTKKFDEKTVLDGFSFQFTKGVYAVMGESGIGKTTLINLITGLILPDSGTIKTDEKTFGIVFQEDRLCENISAVKNITLVTDKPRGEIIAHLETAGLKDNTAIPVRNMSGGMKRRVSIVRALINNPEILILDEPFKGLDDKLKDSIINYVKSLINDKIVIIITHDANDAEKLNAQIYNFIPSGLCIS